MKKLKIYISYLRIKYHNFFENFINLIKFIFRIDHFLSWEDRYSILDRIFVESANNMLAKNKITREMVYYKLKKKHRKCFLLFSDIFYLFKGEIIVELQLEQVKDRFERWELEDPQRFRQILKDDKKEYRYFKKLFKKIHFYLHGLSWNEMHELSKKPDIRLYRFMFDRIVKKEDYDYALNKTIEIQNTMIKPLFGEGMSKYFSMGGSYINFWDKITGFFRFFSGKKAKEKLSLDHDDAGDFYDSLFGKNKK